MISEVQILSQPLFYLEHSVLKNHHLLLVKLQLLQEEMFLSN